MKMDTTSQSPGGNEQHKSTPQEHLHALQGDAQAAIAGIKEQGSTQFEHYRDTAAQQIETLAQSAQTAADQIEDDGGDALGLSHYVTDIAQSMTTLASDMRGKSIDQLLQQAGKLARDNPALFITGSVALGFGLSRFLKASGSSAE
jgi:small-conductance mechanosensitive channel